MTTTPELQKAPFHVAALPAGFAFGEICAAPKAQPTCEVHTASGRVIHQTPEPIADGDGTAAANPNSNANAPPVIQYHVLHTGNFVRVATMPGRLYWVAQNAASHTTPDWKLHVACEPNDVAVVWNLCVLPVFFESASTLATVGMKAVLSADKQEDGTFVTSSGTNWPPEQVGRELTVYLFCDDAHYDECPAGGDDNDDGELHANFHKRQSPAAKKNAAAASPVLSDAQLWRVDHPQVTARWQQLLQRATSFTASDLVRFVERIQQRLDFYQIRTRGCAVGDLALTRSVSLRNEAYTSGAFVKWSLGQKGAAANGSGGDAKATAAAAVVEQEQDESLVYPLNSWGWNAASHELSDALRGLVCHFNQEQLAAHDDVIDARVKAEARPEQAVACCCVIA